LQFSGTLVFEGSFYHGGTEDTEPDEIGEKQCSALS